MKVQCAGGGTVAIDPAPFGLGPTHYERPTHGEPCGWKGERKTRIYAPVTFTFAGGRKHVEDRWLAVDPTAKPCPRCGGRVELIPEVER